MKPTDAVCGAEFGSTMVDMSSLSAKSTRQENRADQIGQRQWFGRTSLLAPLLRKLVARGTLAVTYPNGRREVFGGGAPRVDIRIVDPALPWRLLVRPTLAMGEAYMDGALIIERGSLRDFLDVCTSNVEALYEGRLNMLLAPALRVARLIQQYNPIWRARANVAHHYDLSGQLYRLFLDDDMQYSCAYFATGKETLEEAQEKKKRHIAAKLLLRPGMSVLDIGSGWGGLAIDLARRARVEVTGITLSHEQAKAAAERAAHADVAGRVRFELCDYREQRGSFDRIVSVGMFEHVGVSHYRDFFRTVERLLKPDGVGLIHAIGHMGPPGGCDPWIRKYIFPGGYCPALSEVLAAVEHTGLWVTDVEILRFHYADTLRHWFERFQANRDRVRALYDERFCRMWEFYLAACEMMFRNSSLMVFQVQIARRKDAVPGTRDYVDEAERRLPLADFTQAA